MGYRSLKNLITAIKFDPNTITLLIQAPVGVSPQWAHILRRHGTAYALSRRLVPSCACFTLLIVFYRFFFFVKRAILLCKLQNLDGWISGEFI